MRNRNPGAKSRRPPARPVRRAAPIARTVRRGRSGGARRVIANARCGRGRGRGRVLNYISYYKYNINYNFGSASLISHPLTTFGSVALPLRKASRLHSHHKPAERARRHGEPPENESHSVGGIWSDLM
ncbi:hypothetical protein EVAR_57356_1 [Eumeta japonica]|uniref:Uncharacterized protein n=1 Tax=Eumeta variegata TaxID=151549 RepID=A0A4C1ZCD7_EUMVA|nr:hypothetical protein EVAR_57356_1 [Eumeta japonica]